jgi:hypothetical protein
LFHTQRGGAPVTHKGLAFVTGQVGLVKPKVSMLLAICFICAREWASRILGKGRSAERSIMPEEFFNGRLEDWGMLESLVPITAEGH